VGLTGVTSRDSDYNIEALTAADWPEVRAIYLEGIKTGIATFERSAPAWEDWDANHLGSCRLVARAREANSVMGWAALAPVSRRHVYRGVTEVSVYVSEKARGRGLGRALLRALIEASEECGIWTLQAGIMSENEASLKLHRRCGFREVGKRERIGKLGDTWHDVVLMERRSKRVGID
jgi:L-amino acid N-acyltransferase YncA